MTPEPKPDRRFRLASLLGVVTVVGVAIGLIRLGLSGPTDEWVFRALTFAGLLWLAAVVGAVVGLATGGRKYIVPGAAVGALLCLLVLVFWLSPLFQVNAARE